MRLHRFYIGEKIGNQSQIIIKSKELAHQIRRVFRLKRGDSVVVFDGSGFDYECRLDNFGEKTIISSNNSIILDVTSTSRSNFVPKRELLLCAALVKKDNFEFIVEKATELGVTGVLPILAERSEKKSLNKSRLEKIAVEASEQSGRGNVPIISDIVDLQTVIDDLKLRKENGERRTENREIKIVAFHTDGEVASKYLEDIKSRESLSVAVFIGPEGGWSPEEIELFHRNKIPVVTLGNQILRAETAAVATLSLLMLG